MAGTYLTPAQSVYSTRIVQGALFWHETVTTMAPFKTRSNVSRSFRLSRSEAECRWDVIRLVLRNLSWWIFVCPRPAFPSQVLEPHTLSRLRTVPSTVHSSSDVFAVGLAGTILHYDGASWGAMASGVSTSLDAIWGSSSGDLSVVGSYDAILRGRRKQRS